MIQPLLPKNSMNLLLVCVFQLVGFTSSGQEKKIESDAKQHFSYNNNHLSIGINDIVRGCCIIHYERVIQDRFGVEVGAGLTFDDWYALHYWEGPQYIKRNKPQDTRFTYSINFRCIPFQQVPFLYIAVGSWYRKYYSADQEAFFYYSGYWIGSQRIELNHKLLIGNFFNFGKHFTVDYYVGIGKAQHTDKWGYVDYNPQTTLVTKHERTQNTQVYLGLRVGVSF